MYDTVVNGPVAVVAQVHKCTYPSHEKAWKTGARSRVSEDNWQEAQELLVKSQDIENEHSEDSYRLSRWNCTEQEVVI
jgi:hypothetical protein